MKHLLVGFLTILAVAATARAEDTLTHVHGLSYSPDGGRLMIPSHHGLAIYANGRWSKAPGPRHDYMGFSATASGLYSSGHPAPGSGLVNPFGLLRSRDGGASWDKLGLEGESDFHLLAAGWNTNAVYVWNVAPNSRMKETGLHMTANEGFVWRRARAAGLEGEPRAVAAHPDDPKAIAVATSSGVFESNDSGESFARIAGSEGTAVFYDLDGRHLWYGSYDGAARLVRAPRPQGPIVQIKLPSLQEDAVAYIAQNPQLRSVYAIATFKRNVYVTSEGGKSWKKIADKGVGK